MRERMMELQKSCDDHEKILAEKNATIEDLHTRLTQQAKPCVVKMCNKDIFVAKLKKNSKGPTNVLQIGKSAPYKDRIILYYHHVPCIFKRFHNASSPSQ